MVSDIDNKTIKRIDTLINKGNNVSVQYQRFEGTSSPYNNNVLMRGLRSKQKQQANCAPTFNESPFAEWQSQVLSFLVDLLGTEHTYSRKFKESVTCSCKSCVEKGQGILCALKQDISKGDLTKFKTLVTADIFSDFVDMGEYLLSENYTDAAAVIVGSVLEEHLRHLSQNRNISINLAKGSKTVPKKADAMNADLTKAGAYNKLEMKNITAWLDLRNKAAHGKYNEYDKRRVELMLQGIKDFITRIPT